VHAQAWNERHGQGETARVARLDGDLQSGQLGISSRWRTQISRVSGRVRAVWYTDSADSRPARVDDGANRVRVKGLARQALERASSTINQRSWWRSSRRDFCCTSQTVHCTWFAGSREALKQVLNVHAACTLPARHVVQEMPPSQ
jgi:hypothetical protein